MDRKFGIELEMVGITREQAATALTGVGIEVREEGYNHETRSHWKIVSDASVRGGFELVSPVLRGDAGIEEVRKAATALDDMGATANRSCGYHVHLDAADLTASDIRAIVTRYADHESEIDAFMPPSRRGNTNTYCGSVIGLARSERFRSAGTIRDLANAQGGRYFKVNLQSYYVHKTIEFRQHSGTINAAKITNWVLFLQQFIEACRRPTSTEIAVRGGVQGRLAAMLAEGPVTLEALQEHFGWLPHTARATVARLRRTGLRVAAIKLDGKPGYKLVGSEPTRLTIELFDGIDANIAEFYRNRSAVFAAREER
ncbi:amidoligase family protein [uncultured Bilophila sp.]|mgnify:FL=1|uniref:amidoligase family protein n=1 Tax=uncultured Bilophila sp. TaxID=529385 RepID=UPI00260B56A0|nr:amidoligase family protein [uncultured Bilophila sp.]